jgi:hypothetical protein
VAAAQLADRLQRDQLGAFALEDLDAGLQGREGVALGYISTLNQPDQAPTRSLAFGAVEPNRARAGPIWPNS